MKMDNFSKNELKDLIIKIIKKVGYVSTHTIVSLDSLEFYEKLEIGSNCHKTILIKTGDPKIDQYNLEVRHELLDLYFCGRHERSLRFRQAMKTLTDKDVSFEFVVTSLQLIRGQTSALRVLNNWLEFICAERTA